MKTTWNILVLSAALLPAMVLTSCSTVDDGSYVAPITLYEKIGGTWALNSMTQTDEGTSATVSLTNALEFDTFVIRLQTDSENRPTTFSVEGRAPKLLPLSGNWSMDYDFTKSDGTASRILLEADGKTTALTVTALPGSDNKLGFRLTRRANGQALVSYTYGLTPIQE